MSNEQVIEQIGVDVNSRIGVFPPGAMQIFNRLPSFELSFLTLTNQVDDVGDNISRIDVAFAAAMPEIVAMTWKVSIAQEGFGTSLEELTRRDRDVSGKLKESFAQIDSQLTEVKLQATTVASMQEGIH